MNKKKLVPVVAVLNMKGGVGKTTISAHVFRLMYKKLQAGTLILDLDPQFNLSQALFTRKRYEKLKEEGKTIFSAMGSHHHLVDYSKLKPHQNHPQRPVTLV
jgi:chromosome partitioning protein